MPSTSSPSRCRSSRSHSSSSPFSCQGTGGAPSCEPASALRSRSRSLSPSSTSGATPTSMPSVRTPTRKRRNTSTTSSWGSSEPHCGLFSCSGSSWHSARGSQGRVQPRPRSATPPSASSVAAVARPTRSRRRSPRSSLGIAARCSVLVAAGGAVILVVLSHPGPTAVLIVAIIVLVGLAIIEALSRNASTRVDPVAAA